MIWSRRQFFELAAAALPIAKSGLAEGILASLRILKNCVNTAVIERNGKRLLIDSGEIASLPQLGAVDWVLVTHHHRDQASAVHHLCGEGAKLVVPAAEEHFFSDAEGFWESADNILDHRYDFRPHLFTLYHSAPATRTVKDGDTFVWEGLKFEVIATPGHTEGSVTYLVDLDGKRAAFTGDLICGPGQIWEIYSLQKRFPGMRGDYWGFGGAVEEVKTSLQRVLERKPDFLVPSHGSIITEPETAVRRLFENLDAVMGNYLTTAAWRIYFEGIYPKDKYPMLAPLPPVSYPSWIRNIAATSKAIVADDKSVFLSDCGSQRAIDELARMQAAGEIGALEGIWITHYHDDHTQLINVAKRRFGANVYVQREMVDIVENPTAYQMPCLFPESIRVDRVMEHGETIDWKGFKLTAFHFPGQTIYHGGLLVERDGLKVFFTGDSFANWGVDDYCSQNRCFLGPEVGYSKCFKILLEAKPDILMAAHWGPLPVTSEYLERSLELFHERERLYRKLFPHDEVNFGLDPGWIHVYPYRQKALPDSLVAFEARITNHSLSVKQVRVALSLPHDWKALKSAVEADISARSEGRIRLTARAPIQPTRRRNIIGLGISVDGQSLGEFAEGIVDFLT